MQGERYVWEPAGLGLTAREQKDVRTVWHLENDRKEDADALIQAANPKAAYRFTEGDWQLEAVLTLGEGVDRLGESLLAAGEIGRAYALDCLAMKLLEKMYGELSDELGRVHGRWISRYHFPEEEEELRRLAEELGEGIVTMNCSGMMIPLKSIILQGQLTTREHLKCRGMCASCASTVCPNAGRRRAK